MKEQPHKKQIKKESTKSTQTNAQKEQYDEHLKKQNARKAFIMQL